MHDIPASDQLAEAPPQAEPTVSVVIPTFNYARFLPEALDSIVLQKGARIEVIVVDDGSTDDPASVVGRYPGVKLIRQENRGLAAARNAGLREATGDYIAFVDADDRLVEGAVETWLAEFRRKPDCGLVHGSYRSVDAEWRPIWQPKPVSLGDNGFATLLERGNLIGVPAAVMYRTERLRAIGGFDEKVPGNEDYDLYLRMLRRFPAASSDRIVAEYRYHDANMSRNASLMLSSGRDTVLRQRDAVQADGTLKRAFRLGHAGIQRYWIRAQLRELQRALGRTPERREALGQVIKLFGQAPHHFLRESGAVAFDLARKGLPTKLRWGSLRRTEPLSRDFGYDRGTPIDRFYIEDFLAKHSTDVRGAVLEIKDPSYTRRFGGERVARSEVLDIDAGNANATIVADLNTPGSVPRESFDCVLLTQTLQLIYDYSTALRSLVDALKPGGTLLLTVPGITQIAHRDLGHTWYWAFTRSSIERLMAEVMPGADVRVEAHGNVLAATSQLQGIATEELTERELKVRDLDYQVIVTVRAVKPLLP